MAWVSGGLGATNACTGMYRLDFIAEHGMHSDKDISGPPVPGARVGRPRFERYFDGLRACSGAVLLVTFLTARKVTRARTQY